MAVKRNSQQCETARALLSPITVPNLDQKRKARNSVTHAIKLVSPSQTPPQYDLAKDQQATVSQLRNEWQ